MCEDHLENQRAEKRFWVDPLFKERLQYGFFHASKIVPGVFSKLFSNDSYRVRGSVTLGGSDNHQANSDSRPFISRRTLIDNSKVCLLYYS